MAERELPHIAILSSPGMGFLIPLAELTKLLVLHHNFSATIITHTIQSMQKTQNTILATLPKSVESVSLPAVPPHQIPLEAKLVTRISLTQKLSIPSIRRVLSTLASTRRLVALVVDLFGTDAFDAAAEVGVPPYIFYTSLCVELSLFLHLPALDAALPPEGGGFVGPVELPGCRPIGREHLMEDALDRSSEDYAWALHHGRRFKEAKGILVNIFAELEPEALKGLGEDPSHPPVYPVGPIVRVGSTCGADGPAPSWLRWLDDQPTGSVLLVNFGSGGTLSSEQMKELALGLETSEQRFLWVVRSPSEKDAAAAFFGAVESEEEEEEEQVSKPLDFLPEGFLERSEGVGHVVQWWVPQEEVLSHGSVGGFLSHCGWNSTLESMVHGVAMIAWPLYAEQGMNAVLLVEDLKVAMRPRASEREGGLVKREEIARVVRDLIEGGEEGKRVKERMKELKEASVKALAAEDGSSYRALSEVLSQWKRN